jgi:Glycosyltransferase like family 2
VARLDALVPQLDPYRVATNEERVAAVRRPRRDLRGVDRRPGLSVIVLNRDRADLVEQLWDGWRSVAADFEEVGVAAELIVGDTGSTEPAARALLDRPPPGCTVVFDLAYHFSRCNNDLFVQAAYDRVLFMNNDVIWRDEPHAIRRAYDLLGGDESIGALGAVLYFADGTTQHAGIDFFTRADLAGFCYHPSARCALDVDEGDVFDAPAATGAFMMMRSELFALAGGFDESYAAECQDVDLCLRLRRLGHRTRVAHLGRLVHLENATRPLGEEHWDDRALFVRRWSSFVEAM